MIQHVAAEKKRNSANVGHERVLTPVLCSSTISVLEMPLLLWFPLADSSISVAWGWGPTDGRSFYMLALTARLMIGQMERATTSVILHVPVVNYYTLWQHRVGERSSRIMFTTAANNRFSSPTSSSTIIECLFIHSCLCRDRIYAVFIFIFQHVALYQHSERSAHVTGLSPSLSVRKVYCCKTADCIRMLFGMVSEVGRGMGVLDGGGDCRREGTVLVVNFGRLVVTNGDFDA